MFNSLEALRSSRTRINKAKTGKNRSGIWHWHHIIQHKCIYSSRDGDLIIICLWQWIKKVYIVIRVQLRAPAGLAIMALFRARARMKHRKDGTQEIVPPCPTLLSCQVDLMNDSQHKAFSGTVALVFYFHWGLSWVFH